MSARDDIEYGTVLEQHLDQMRSNRWDKATNEEAVNILATVRWLVNQGVPRQEAVQIACAARIAGSNGE